MKKKTEKNSQPVFFDVNRKRWRYSKRVLVPLIVFIFSVFGVTLLSFVFGPTLPPLNVNNPAEVYRNAAVSPSSGSGALTSNSNSGQTKIFAGSTLDLSGKPLNSWNPSVPGAPPNFPSFHPMSSNPNFDPKVLAYFVNWDDNSFVSLKKNLGKFDQFVPEWLYLSDSQGTVSPYNDAYQKKVLSVVRASRPDLKITPIIDNFNSQTGDWDSGRLTSMLKNSDLRSKTIQGIQDYLTSNNFSGISVDFENIPDEDQADFGRFAGELYGRLHSMGLEVSINVPLDSPSYNYAALSRSADYLILMAYDQNTVYDGPPGPIASQEWFEKGLNARFKDLPSNKFIVSLGNYGYDWQGQSGGKSLTFEQAMREAKDASASASLDPATLNSNFSYYDSQNVLHQVWYLDGVSAFDQLAAIRNLGSPAGVALWRLGSEDPTVWNDLANLKNLDSKAADSLSEMEYGYDVAYDGKGEILKVISTPQKGNRTVTFDAQSGFIKDSKVMSYPSPYLIDRWGGTSDKRIALTFDDGPDRTYTPQILDILKKENATAAFFTIGANANLNPDLIKEEYANGNEIGSHTYTHPDLSKIPTQQVNFELDSTERVLEGILGRKTLIFRPPYAEDIEPVTPDQVGPLAEVNRLGYYTVGMHIDPKDWNRPGVDNIVQSVLDGAQKGGHIVLLHDGGGNRAETVQALPKIIEALRSNGYEIVPVSELMGVPRSEMMPRVTWKEAALARLNGVSISFVTLFDSFMRYMFIIGIVLGVTRFIFVGILAIIQKIHSRFGSYRKLSSLFDFKPSVSVIIPAYNEEKVIVKTVRSILRSDYPNFDIVVVDDGSTDETFLFLENTFRNDPRVRIFRKENGGKSSALNFGIEKTRAEIVVTLDADTVFRPDTISLLVRRFVDRRVAAVAGNAKVGNRVNLLTSWQALEYITSQNLDRRAFDVMNCITVVPGAIGAWRKKAVLEAGGFSSDTLAEDADLTFEILRRGHLVAYDDEAVAYTEAPQSAKNFIKQRFRWMFGTLQTAWKHKDTLGRKKYGTLGIFAIPNIFIFQIFFPLVSPLMDLMMILSLSWAAWQAHYHPIDYSSFAAFHKFFQFYVFFLAVDFVTSAIPFFLEPRENWSLLIWLPFQRFYYRQLMYWVAIKSTLAALKGRLVGWGKFERKATVTEVRSA